MTPQQATDARIDRRQTRDATEQRILDGTTRLLNDGASLAGLSVNRIAEESGVSRATRRSPIPSAARSWRRMSCSRPA